MATVQGNKSRSNSRVVVLKGHSKRLTGGLIKHSQSANRSRSLDSVVASEIFLTIGNRHARDFRFGRNGRDDISRRRMVDRRQSDHQRKQNEVALGIRDRHVLGHSTGHHGRAF